MTAEERARLLDIRKRGKTAKLVSSKERTFCEEMWERFPEEYAEVEKEMQKWLHAAHWSEVI